LIKKGFVTFVDLRGFVIDRVENRSRLSRAARWSREKFDAVAETSQFRIILRARTFFASWLTAGPRSS
jgi:hypothetical protein